MTSMDQLGNQLQAPEEDSSLSVLERKREQSTTLQALEDLSKNQQEVLRLKFQEGLSYKEISHITGHSVSHVGVLIHEAMMKLRENLSERSLS